MKRRAVAVIGVMAGLVVISVLGVGFSSATFHAQSANPTNTFTAATSFCSGTTTQTVTADRDTYVDQNSPNSTAGGSTSLIVNSKSNKNERTLVGFTLPSKPVGCSVTSATLKLTATGSDSGRTLASLPDRSGRDLDRGGRDVEQPAGFHRNGGHHHLGLGPSTVDRDLAGPGDVRVRQPEQRLPGQGPDGERECDADIPSREASTNKPQLSITFG